MTSLHDVTSCGGARWFPVTSCCQLRSRVWELSSTPYTWTEKFESFERINSIRETNGNFDSCNSCKRLGTSRLHELHESKFPFVSRIEFIRSKLSNFSVHVYGVDERSSRWRLVWLTRQPLARDRGPNLISMPLTHRGSVNAVTKRNITSKSWCVYLTHAIISIYLWSKSKIVGVNPTSCIYSPLWQAEWCNTFTSSTHRQIAFGETRERCLTLADPAKGEHRTISQKHIQMGKIVSFSAI